MKFFWITVYCCMACVLPAHAQETAGLPFPERSVSVQEEWQLTVDVIKGKVQSLLEENTGLTNQQHSILEQDKKLQQSILRQTRDNDAIRKSLDQRKGRTDQQIRLDDIEHQVMSRKAQLAGLERDVRSSQKQAQLWMRKVDAERLKIHDLELHQKSLTDAAQARARGVSGDRELDELRKELEQQKAQEAILESKMSAMDAQAVDPELKMLEEKVKLLRHEKARLMRINGQKNAAAGGAHERYATMMRHKFELESKVRSFTAQITALKNPSARGLSWALEKKQLVRDIVKADARNRKMREQVNNLREDISVLGDQIAKQQKLVSYGGDFKNAH